MVEVTVVIICVCVCVDVRAYKEAAAVAAIHSTLCVMDSWASRAVKLVTDSLPVLLTDRDAPID